MEITEVRIFPKEGQDKKLKAYATITLDNCFVVRNVKVIQGNKGLFVAMPSRKVRESCPKCNHKNPIRSKYCNNCGANLPQPTPQPQATGSQVRESEHRDIAHPINIECRTLIQKKVLEAYEGADRTGARPTEEAATAENTPFVEEKSNDEIDGKDIAL